MKEVDEKIKRLIELYNEIKADKKFEIFVAYSERIDSDKRSLRMRVTGKPAFQQAIMFELMRKNGKVIVLTEEDLLRARNSQNVSENIKPIKRTDIN